jgi:hypothetical protein
VPQVKLTPFEPLEGLYPPRPLSWSDTQFREFAVPAPPPQGSAELEDYLDRCLAASHFRNLNMAQARGADHMMIAHVEEARRGFEEIGRSGEQRGRLKTALESPYPFAHYLACRVLARHKDQPGTDLLVRSLERFVKQQEEVGYWWCCEALAERQAREALPVLARYAGAKNRSGFFGPEGMATGYVAARALARIAADAKDPVVARLLQDENIWLRAAALRGLAEAGAQGIDHLLEDAARESSPALIRHEARLQLHRLAK